MKHIIIYSKTGNTLCVGQALNQKLNTDILSIIPASDDPNIVEPILTINPSIDDFDELILGTPVHGFLPSKVMQTYILSHDFLNKKVHIFVTHHFPFAWMGGKSAIKKMQKLIENQNGHVVSTHIINWSSKKRNQNIDDFVKAFS